MPQRPLCDGGVTAPTEVARIFDPSLSEISGLVSSPTHPGVLWVHNDRGDRARVFALSTNGALLGEVSLPGIAAVDFEDIAAAPCPDLSGPCIYVADTGDNDHTRDELAVIAFPEPEVAVDRPLPDGAAPETTWRFPLLADDHPDIEAFVVTPDARDMIFYEKERTNARIFRSRAPWTPDVPQDLEETETFDPPLLGDDSGGPTGADLHPSGERLLLRTHNAVFEVRLDERDGYRLADVKGSSFAQLFAVPPDEHQGEAVGFADDGRGIWTVSERLPDDAIQPIHFAACQ